MLFDNDEKRKTTITFQRIYTEREMLVKIQWKRQ